MRRYFFLIAFLASLGVSYGQRKVSLEEQGKARELKLKYKDAEEALLKSTTTYRFQRNKQNEVEVIETTEDKIMSLSINHSLDRFRFYDSYSEIESLIGQYNNGAIFRIRSDNGNYSSNGIFHSDARVCRYSLWFKDLGEFQKVEEKKVYTDLKYLTTAYFHNPAPVEKRVLSFILPNWVEVELKEFNFEGYDIKRTEKTQKNGKETVITYELSNLDPIADESNSPGRSHIYPHLIFVNKPQEDKSKTPLLFASTDDLYNWYATLVKEVKNDSTVIKELVDKIVDRQASDEVKMRQIFYWVQDNIRYVAFEDGLAGYRPASAQDVLLKKYGDCKGMANLCKALLTEAGVEAHLTWLGTKDRAYDYSTPSLVVDNHMICTAVIDGKRIFLDATEDYISADNYAERIQGQAVMIENGDNFILDQIPETGYDKNLIEVNQSYRFENEVLVGKAEEQYHGESRTNILRGLKSLETNLIEEAFDNYLTNGDKNIKVTDVTTSSLEDRDNPLEINYGINLNNRISVFDELVYIDLDPDKEFQTSYFKDRKTDFWFDNKFYKKMKIEVSIPEGYKLEHLPANFSFDEEDFAFSFTFREEAGKVIYEKTLALKTAVLKKERFPVWDKCIKEMNEKVYEDQVLLIKP